MSRLTGPAPSAAATRPPGGAERRRWAAVAVVSVCVLVPFMDITMIGIDLTKITRELSITWVGAQWAVGGYLLVCGVCMLVVPAVGGRWGYRRTLAAGFTLFGVGAVVAAWAPGAGVFIAARVAMGVGAAVVLPAWVSIISAMFPPESRKRAFAAGAAFVSATTPFGPIIGGALLDRAWYGSLFVLDAVIVALVVPFVLWLTPETRAGGGRRPDLIGIGLAACAATALFAAFAGARPGWQLMACLAAVVAALAAFVRRQRTAVDPLIDLVVLRRPGFIWSQLTISSVNFAWTGLLFLLPVYLQVVRGASALMVALLLVPLAAMASVASLVTERVTRRLGVRWTVICGLLVFAVGLALFSLVVDRPGYALFVAALALVGLGAGLPQAPALVAALGALPERSAANGPGVVNALRHIGGALGVAVGGLAVATIFTNGLAGSGAAAAHASVVDLAAGATGSLAAAAFTEGVATSLRGGAVLLAALAVLAMLLPERPTRQRDDTTSGR
ncbi:MFS transporter [Dactylosporangium sp. NPDC005555]|uniref:MFS transporter n=1 Tax=Dactylosporangium sp. NPDC005555 TaxID=3154889 RepID=UPI0033B251AF